MAFLLVGGKAADFTTKVACSDASCRSTPYRAPTLSDLQRWHAFVLAIFHAPRPPTDAYIRDVRAELNRLRKEKAKEMDVAVPAHLDTVAAVAPKTVAKLIFLLEREGYSDPSLAVISGIVLRGGGSVHKLHRNY